ncbi:hypothetical protein Pd630_LPD09200 (plasmid) [Rhodococcus opacus PD630]|nr:hypothetical protein Pd630_LPD09200 [Rhodococcus opacus PD630]
MVDCFPVSRCWDSIDLVYDFAPEHGRGGMGEACCIPI